MIGCDICGRKTYKGNHICSICDYPNYQKEYRRQHSSYYKDYVKKNKDKIRKYQNEYRKKQAQKK